MKRISWIIIFLNLLALLAFFNFSITAKEQLMKEGQLILLELTPVDPRSLMQGDYMQLNYSITRNYSYDSTPKRGFAVVKIDSNKVASLVRFQRYNTPVFTNELLIEYTTDGRQMNIGAGAYFFQEKKAAKYDSACYGAIHVNKHGKSILTGLYNRQLQPL